MIVSLAARILGMLIPRLKDGKNAKVIFWVPDMASYHLVNALEIKTLET